MTVSASTGYSGPYTPNGSTTAFPFTFSAASAAEVQVQINGTVVSTGFTVTLNSNQVTNPGGTVTFAVAPIGTSLVVVSNPDFAQEIAFTNAGPFDASSHDEVADQAARRDIALRRDVDQAIQVPLGTTVPSYETFLATVKGDPGGDAGDIGLLSQAPLINIPDGIDIVATAGAAELDEGAAVYVAGTAPTARSGFTSANTRNFVLSKEQVIVPQQFYQATDPDFQNAMQGSLDYVAATASNVIAPWYRGGTKIVLPQTSTTYLLHAALEPAYTGKIEGEDTGFHDGHGTKLKWTAGTCGFIFQDINTSGTTGTRADGFAPAGFELSGIHGEGGLDDDATEGEFDFILARTRVILKNISGTKWQGDAVKIQADVSAPSKGEASLSQIDTARFTRVRNGVAVIGADANIVKVQSVDVVYARRWGYDFRDFLGVNPIGNHTSGCGFFNPGYTPSLCTYSGNTYAVVAGQETGASTNAPSGTTADNAYWYYCYAGGASAPLNIVAWTSGLTWLAGGPYHVNGAGSPTMLVNCYSETGMGPSQLPYLAMMIGGLHGAGVKGAHFAAHNGMPTAIRSIAAEKDGDTTTRVVVGSGEDTADGSILSIYTPALGGANVARFNVPTSFSPNVFYWSNWGGSFTDDLVPFQMSMNGTSGGDAPWGRNRLNCPTGLGIGGKLFDVGTAAPTGAMVGGGNWPVGARRFNSAPAVGQPESWLCTVSGSPGTWIALYSIGAKDTGWTADTGTAKKTATATYAPGATLTYSATYVQAEQTATATRLIAVEAALRDATQEIKALKDALIAQNIIGT